MHEIICGKTTVHAHRVNLVNLKVKKIKYDKTELPYTLNKLKQSLQMCESLVYAAGL